MKTTLLMGIHCHQPVGNFDEVVLEAIEKSYKPFFETLQSFPNFKCSVHFSGWLLEFIYLHKPHLFELMQKLSPQLEFFTGGYYEPILSSIPSKDRIGQIQKLSRFIRNHFGQTPKGLWLTERVWDNSLIADLSRCGIKYVIVDDYHFIASGYDATKMNGYYLTENGGETMALFPISRKLRYDIPFASTDEVNETLHGFAAPEGENAAIIFDDGEKFGIWPKTFERVYEQQWLEEFFTRCLQDPAIRVQTFNEYYKKQRPVDLAYIADTSYVEMGQWSLSTHHALAFKEAQKQLENEAILKGGVWKNFLSKYQESNWIQKRFLELSKKQSGKKKYLEALYKAQCNDVLWHGVFGGIYLPNLRDNAYRFLIECENQLFDKAGCEKIDIDLNGYKEYKLQSKELLLILSQKGSGQIYELDLKDRLFNLQNTLTRYKEAYHERIERVACDVAEDEDTKTIHDNTLRMSEDIALHYDWHLKKSAIDHLCDESLNLESFEQNSYAELGDFANQPFQAQGSGKGKVAFSREGGIYRYDTRFITKLEKTYKLKKNSLACKTKLATAFEQPLRYMQEWNLHFPNIDSIRINGNRIDEAIHIYGNRLTVEDGILQKRFEFIFEQPTDIYAAAMRTISQSEAGVDATVQGVAFGFCRSFEKHTEFNVTFTVTDL